MRFTQAFKPLAMGFFALLTVGCMKGPKGDPGIPGAGKIISTLNCGGNITSGGGIVTSGGGIPVELHDLRVEYDVVLTSGGDVYATAVIVDNSYQASGTAFYAADQVGAQTAVVYVTADYVDAVNGGLWKISLDRATLITSIVYDDPSLGSQVKMTFTPSACTVQYW